MLWLTAGIIIGWIVYTLGKYTVMVSVFTVTFKVVAMALVVAALLLLYRKFRSRGRAASTRRLGP